MATAIVLSSRNNRFDHETLTHRNPNSSLRRQSHAASKAPRQRKRNPTTSKSPVVKPPAAKTNLVMEQVKILKRGETLNSFQNKENDRCGDTIIRPVLKKTIDVDLIVSSTSRLGPEPDIVMKQIGAFKGLEIVSGNYAGTRCDVSPPPSSVPIPCFLGKINLLV